MQFCDAILRSSYGTEQVSKALLTCSTIADSPACFSAGWAPPHDTFWIFMPLQVLARVNQTATSAPSIGSFLASYDSVMDETQIMSWD
jgi:hypothetical protein